MKHLTGLFLLTLLFFSSCRKEDAPQRIANNVRLSRLENQYRKQQFFYNADGSLSRALQQERNGDTVKDFRYQYIQGLVAGTSVARAQVTYEWLHADSLRLIVRNEGGQPTYTMLFRFSGDRLERWWQYQHADGLILPRERTDFTYNAQGNLVERKHYDHDGAQWLLAHTVQLPAYDRQPNWSASFELTPYWLGKPRLVQNNPLREEFRNAAGHLFKTIVWQYQYNADGLKVRATKTISEDHEPTRTEHIHYTY